MFEETGLTIDKGQVLLTEGDFYEHPNTKNYHQSVLLYFLCVNPQGEISTANFDEAEKEYAKAAQWIPVDDVRSLKFYNPIDSPALIEHAYEVHKAL